MKKEIDFEALYVSLNAKRITNELSWKGVARELEISPSTLTNLSRGKGVDSSTFVTLTSWLGVPSENFVKGGSTSPEAKPTKTMDVIAGHLRADRSLKPESARAIETVIEAAYERLRKEPTIH